jgi:PAS domain S-box-containing protein
VKAIKEGRPYSMAFVDVRMPPGWDGIETVSKIWEVNPDLQVVICTAFSDYSWHKMHEILGTSDKLLILKKPFDNLEVLQMASTLTEKWRLQEAMRAHLINMEATVKQRTEQLWASESRFHFLAENVSDLVAIFDAEASPIYLSPSYGGILGFTQEESADLGISGRVHPDDYGIIAGTVERVRSTGVGEWVRFRLSDRKGKWVAIEGRAAVFGSGGGEGFSMLAVGSKGS